MDRSRRISPLSISDCHRRFIAKSTSVFGARGIAVQDGVRDAVRERFAVISHGSNDLLRGERSHERAAEGSAITEYCD